jgi:6-pyruvoyltetrahydropterin/6-carboxytetrahydropterin synthase
MEADNRRATINQGRPRGVQANVEYNSRSRITGMAKGEHTVSVVVTKEFTFDSAHQLVNHDGKCANLHGHTYKVEVALKADPVGPEDTAKEGFVVDFTDLKAIVKKGLIDKLDHAFIAKGDEPALKTLQESGSKVVVLGFRSTCENMAQYMVHWMLVKQLPVYYVRVWETPTGSAIVYSQDVVRNDGPIYNTIGGCDLD